MAPPKRRTGGRVTAKGTRPGDSPVVPKANADEIKVTRATTASSRYTPPTPVHFAESKRWVPYLMFGLWILGGLMIILNYLGVLLPGAVNNWYLLGGLGLILGGLMVATQYR
jgi:Cell division protein CrgA